MEDAVKDLEDRVEMHVEDEGYRLLGGVSISQITINPAAKISWTILCQALVK